MLVAAPAHAHEEHGNLKVLKGLTDGEVHATMDYIAAALGVRCSHCHVGGAGKPFDWESDDKPAKKRSREMMEMTIALNKKTFPGDVQVSCWTCHAGHADPQTVPPVGTAAVPLASAPAGTGKRKPAPGEPPPLPKLDEVLGRYEKALGGRGALAKLASRVAKAQIEQKEGGPPIGLEQTQRSTGASLTVITFPRGTQRRGTDGKTGWVESPRGARELAGADLDDLKADGDLFHDIRLKQRLPDLRVVRREKLGDRELVVLSGKRGKRTEHYAFDAQSGLLVRRLVLDETPVGEMPELTEFDDWRDVGGVKEPFVVRVTPVDADEAQTIRYSEIKHNVKVDDGLFAKPANAAPPAH